MIVKHDGTFTMVRHGSAESVPVGSDIGIYGIHSNGEGTLTHKNATMNESGGRTFTGMG